MDQGLPDLIERVAAAASIEPSLAEQAIGAILAFLRKEGAKDDIDELFAAMPGAAAAASAADEAGAGMLGGVMGMMGGGLMGLAGRLAGLGLGMVQMQAIGHEVFAYIKEKAGDDRVSQAAAKIPGLSQFL